MTLRSCGWLAAGLVFATGTIWINYFVKVNIQTPFGGSSSRELGAIKLASTAPEFTATDLDGRTVKLSQFRDQNVVLIDFWATWCGPCKMAMPGLQTLLDDYKSRGLEILSVNQGETAEQAGEFMKKKGYGFHVLLDPDSSIGSRYGVRGIPTLVAVDKKGVVRWIQVGYSPDETALRRSLENLLGP